MDARLRGGLVLVVALLAVLITAGVNQRVTAVAGLGAAAPPPGPPSVGMCMLQPTASGISFEVPRDGFVMVPPLPIGDCAGARFGEVFVVQDFLASAVAREDPLSFCPGMLEYLGIVEHSPETDWQPAFSIGMTAGGPDARQAGVGQRWVACVVMKEGGLPYEGSLRGSLAGGQLAQGLAQCAEGPGFMASKSCVAPHRVEVFGYKTLFEPVPSQHDLDVECEQIVRRTTLMPDIFADGALSVRSEITEIAAEFRPPPATATCLVATTDKRKIVGSLIGLGEGEIRFQ